MVALFVCAVTMQGWADAEEKLKGVAEIIAVITVESVGAIIYCELRSESDVEAVAMRQVAHVTERAGTYGKEARVCCERTSSNRGLMLA
jgi:hypothetical protein